MAAKLSDEVGESPHSAYSEEATALLHRFLAYVDPSSLPNNESSTPLDEPIIAWDVLYSTQPQFGKDLPANSVNPSIVVRSHPSPHKHLFSVQSVIPGVDAKQFWALMANGENRSLWDSTVEKSSVHCWLANYTQKNQSTGKNRQYQQLARQLSARIELLRFGSIMFVASKRDMVLLSIDTQLPSSDGRLRLVSTSTSVEVADLPVKKGYNRFHLNIGGFLVEDLIIEDTGRNGKAIRVTQVSDLGEMASWVPASIVKMVASTMVPRSMANISKAASKMRVPVALLQQGDGYCGDGDGEAGELDQRNANGIEGSWQPRRYLPPLLSSIASFLPQSTQADETTSRESASMIELISGPEKHPEPSTPIRPIQVSKSSPRKEDSSSKYRLSMPLSHEQIERLEIPHDSSSRETISSKPSSPQSPFALGHLSGSETVSGSIRSSLEGLREEEVDFTVQVLAQENEVKASATKAAQQSSLNTISEFNAMPRMFVDELSEEADLTQTDRSKTLSKPQMATQRRASAFLFNGSDALAMALAPGDRESMRIVAHIVDSQMDLIASPAPAILEEEELAECSAPVSRRLASSSTLAPPMTSMTSAGGQIDKRRSEHGCFSRSTSSAGSSTLCDEDSNSTALKAKSIGWLRSGILKEGSYSLAMGILSIATSWALSSSIPESDQMPSSYTNGSGTPQNGHDCQTERDALTATRRAYQQRVVLIEVATNRPRSHYRTDDGKLQPFPLIAGENLPPLGIASGAPIHFMPCAPAKDTDLQQLRPQRQQSPESAGWWPLPW